MKLKTALIWLDVVLWIVAIASVGLLMWVCSARGQEMPPMPEGQMTEDGGQMTEDRGQKTVAMVSPKDKGAQKNAVMVKAASVVKPPKKTVLRFTWENQPVANPKDYRTGLVQSTNLLRPRWVEIFSGPYVIKANAAVTNPPSPSFYRAFNGFKAGLLTVAPAGNSQSAIANSQGLLTSSPTGQGLLTSSPTSR